MAQLQAEYDDARMCNPALSQKRDDPFDKLENAQFMVAHTTELLARSEAKLADVVAQIWQPLLVMLAYPIESDINWDDEPSEPMNDVCFLFEIKLRLVRFWRIYEQNPAAVDFANPTECIRTIFKEIAWDTVASTSAKELRRYPKPKFLAVRKELERHRYAKRRRYLVPYGRLPEDHVSMAKMPFLLS